MKYTETYQLNQWEKTDRIQMEDFNSDNARVEAALAAQMQGLTAERTAREALRAELLAAYPLVKLADVTTKADARQVEIDVSGIDFTACQQVDVYFRSKLSGYATTYFYLNESLEKEYYPIGTSNGSSAYYNTNNIATMASWRYDAALTGRVHLDLGMPCAGNGILCRMYHGAVGPDYVDKSQTHYISTSIKWEGLKKLVFLSGKEEVVLCKGTNVTVMGVKR